MGANIQFTSSSSSSYTRIFFLVLLLLLSSLPSSSSSSSSHSSPTSKNPFTHELTGVSGFGTRSQRKTIFPVTTTTVTVSNGDTDTDDDEDDVTTTKKSSSSSSSSSVPIRRIEFNRSKILPTDQSNSRLFVKKTKDPNDTLWIQVRDDDNNDASTTTTTILRLSVNENTGDWDVEQQHDKYNKEEDKDKDDTDTDWIPIEGIYGMYRVPSGIVWVLISKTEKVYDAPPLLLVPSSSSSEEVVDNNSNNNNKSCCCWWKIRRVVNLELVHLSRPNLFLSTSHLKEEIRQLKLLRQALKYHDFYFVVENENKNENESSSSSSSSSSSTPHVKDMTKKLQFSLDTTINNNSDNNSDDTNNNNTQSTTTTTKKKWWDKDSTTATRPDPRFFWNQVAIQPMLSKLNTSDPDSKDTNDIIATLLKNSIPLTSAFVGIKTNLTVVVGDHDDVVDGGVVGGGESEIIKYDQLLISRRSKYRAGTRFTRRGADATGSVANFVETEQIALVYNNDTTAIRHIMSHVQTRGSVPLRWSSPADVKTYRPRVRIGMDPLAQARALRLHLLEQFAYYGSSSSSSGSSDTTSPPLNAKPELVFVNLIDKHSDQGRLGRTFDAVLNAVMEVHAKNQTEDTTTSATELTDPSNKSATTVRGFFSRLLGYSTTTEQEVEPSTNTTHQKRGPSAEHIWYDFHAEVKGGRWHKLGTLLKDLEPSLLDHGFFQADVVTQNATEPRFQVQRRQTGAIRTNCMDCLDRTNVVQSMLGRYMLFQQLSTTANAVAKEKNITTTEKWNELTDTFENNQLTLPWSDGEAAHRLLWADNADAISRLYSGTPALKRDFTRTGKRTKRGALDDGMNSLQRYYLNNFLDADRQEGMDLLVGYSNFSNADFLEEEDDDVEEGEGGSYSDDADEKVMLSIQEAARKTFFGDILDGLNPQGKDDVKKSLDEIGIRGGTRVGRRNLDLRWLPGDLQCHVISQVEENVQESTTTLGSKHKMDEKSDYCSTKALEAIDHRSASFFPWWAEFEDSTEFDYEKSEEGKDGEASVGVVEGIDLPLPQHQQQVGPLPPVQLLGVVLLAIQAPTILAGIVVALLMLTFSPDIN